LRCAPVEDLKVFAGETADGPAVVVDDDYVKPNEFDSCSERRCLLCRLLRRQAGQQSPASDAANAFSKAQQFKPTSNDSHEIAVMTTSPRNLP
jgi:hypothetical protein